MKLFTLNCMGKTESKFQEDAQFIGDEALLTVAVLVYIMYVSFLIENFRRSCLTSLRNKYLLRMHLLLDADCTKFSGQVQIVFLQTALATALQPMLLVQVLPMPAEI
jgi:hypothetical protein